MSAETTLAAHLGTSVAALTVGTNLFAGPMRDNAVIPNDAVFVLESGGPAAEKLLDDSGGSNKRITLRVFIRTTGDSYAAGKTLADSVFDAGHNASLSGYAYCLAESSSPYYFGQDDKGRHQWSVIFNVLQRT